MNFESDVQNTICWSDWKFGLELSVVDILISKRSFHKIDCPDRGKWQVSSPEPSLKGTERQAQGQAEVSNPGLCDKVQNDRQAQGQGRQNGQKPGKLETGTRDRKERGKKCCYENKMNW